MATRLDRVVVTTDFSENAHLALRRAALLPLPDHSSILLLHVIAEGAPEKVLAPAKALLRELVDELRHRLGPRERTVAVEGAVRRGEPFEEIVRTARAEGGQLLVVGRHGAGGFKQLLLGTTAGRVIRRSAVPVLVVTTPPRGAYRHPLVAVGLDEVSRTTVDLALGVLEKDAPPGLLVHAYNVPFEELVGGLSRRGESRYRKQLREESEAALRAFVDTLPAAARGWRVVNRSGDARTVILSEATKARADLVALGTHARAGIVHTFLGSVAESVIARTTCDVLVVRPPKSRGRAP